MCLQVLVPPTVTPVQLLHGLTGTQNKKVNSYAWYSRGRELWSCTNLHLAINSSPLPQCFLKTAGCKVLCCISFSAFSGQTGSYWLCYHFTWARCPSLLCCADTGYISLLQYLLPLPKVLKRTELFSYNLWRKSQLSVWYCSPKRQEKL